MLKRVAGTALAIHPLTIINVYTQILISESVY